MGVNGDRTRDRIARAYARLSGLRVRLDTENKRETSFEHVYVDEFHEALARLTACAFDIEEFKVKPEQMRPSAVRGRSFVDRTLLLAKLDAVLTYFDVLTVRPEQPKPPLGFHGRTG